MKHLKTLCHKALRRLFAATALIATATSAQAGPGMWIPTLLGKNIADMQAQGFKLTAQDVYDVNNASLKDAVVIFGGGCTGEIVSQQGLLLTNYHCGQDAISNLSSVEHDYLGQGFAAQSMAEELPCPGLTVRRLVSMSDVTATAKRGEKELDEALKAASENGRYETEAEEFFGGNQTFMLVYEVFSDIRLVVAPSQQLGHFGGETDNWIWPRHTADFSAFRIYADKDNKPAKYSESNVPYKPKRHLKVNMAGMEEGDFAMVMGYPGSTNQYMTSGAVAAMSAHAWPKIVELRTAETDVLGAHMKAKRETAINYASHFSSIANGQKRTAGEIECVGKANIVEQKRAAESERKAKDAGLEPILNSIDSIYGGTDEASAHVRAVTDLSLLSDVMRGAGYLRLVRKALAAERNKTSLSELGKSHFGRYDAEAEYDLAKASLTKAYALLSPENRPEQIASRRALRRTLRKLKRCAFADSAEFCTKAAAAQPMKELESDFALKLYTALSDKFRAVRSSYEKSDTRLTELRRDYIGRLMASNPDSLPMADANFTLRVSYGRVESPRTGIADVDKWYTTADGIIAKHATGNIDYTLNDAFLSKFKPENYGRYAAADGTLRTCFVGSLHTTGGNSGSPTLNARGELVGLNFDRIWHGIASDFHFDPERSRNITVDIRYVLFVIDVVCGAPHIVNEMDLVTKR